MWIFVQQFSMNVNLLRINTVKEKSQMTVVQHLLLLFSAHPTFPIYITVKAIHFLTAIATKVKHKGQDSINKSGFNLTSTYFFMVIDEESESAGETESSERSVVAKAIETISHVITSEVIKS